MCFAFRAQWRCRNVKEQDQRNKSLDSAVRKKTDVQRGIKRKKEKKENMSNDKADVDLKEIISLVHFGEEGVEKCVGRSDSRWRLADWL